MDTVPRGGLRAGLPYVVPFALYMAFLAVQSRLPAQSLVWLYPLKAVAVAAALVAFRRHYEELAPRLSPLAIVTGALCIALWVALDPFYPGLSRLTGGAPVAPFDPAAIADATQRLGFLDFRVAGAVIVVPLTEELFWRGFLIRWLVKDDFKGVPVGRFTPLSFGVTVALFGVEHEQWLAGMICGALYNGLLYRTKNVTDCVVAHATSNALLAAWVLARGDWKFW